MSDFEQATVLVVEDNAMARRLLSAVLRAIGVGRIATAANGAEAIRLLRALAARERAAEDRLPDAAETVDGDPPARIDAVISDWVMHPGDGESLLRWIRRHPDSPNRFVPFLMLSADADPPRVRRARDLGASAFIAKPFTADTVARYLFTALADARRYVEVGGYFGPDRRKRPADLSEAERRDLDRSDREKGVRFYVPPQLHERRLAPGEGVDAQRLMAIQKVIAQRADSFVEWAKEALARLDLEIDSAAKRPESERRPHFSRITLIAHELRGQGTTFGYPLISALSKGLQEVSAHSFDRSDATLALIRDHARALKQVVRDRLIGDGGDAGRRLVEDLAARRSETSGSGGAQSAPG